MKNLILGTDWWTDCDDAVAVRLLTRAVRAGEIRLLGVGINACMEHSVASMRAFLAADGVDGVPIGIDADATDYGGNPSYQKRLAKRMPSVTNGDAEDAVRLYRRLLSETDGPIEIAEIGFLQVLSAVLKSGGDEVSPKSGAELVREKVRKVWVMGGKWDADGEREHNFCKTARARVAAREFCELCPVPVTFLGWEVGYGVITGDRLPVGDHLRTVLSDHGSEKGRHSWDPMLVLLCLVGDEAAAGYGTVTGWASVDPETGANFFVRDGAGPHRFVVKAREDAFYAKEINRRL